MNKMEASNNSSMQGAVYSPNDFDDSPHRVVISVHLPLCSQLLLLRNVAYLFIPDPLFKATLAATQTAQFECQ